MKKRRKAKVVLSDKQFAELIIREMQKQIQKHIIEGLPIIKGIEITAKKYKRGPRYDDCIADYDRLMTVLFDKVKTVYKLDSVLAVIQRTIPA